jgi:hypothetical protein
VAESSWPSPSNGRVIDDSSYEKVALSYGPDGGIVGDFTSPQLVSGDSSGMQVKVAADRYALVRGHEWWSGSTIFTKAIGANASGSTRTDLVVLRLSRTTWDVTVTVIAGTPGSGAPAPVQNLGTTGSFDLPLATVTVASGASTVSAGNVTYVAPHLTPDGSGYRTPTVASLAYIPNKMAGMNVTLPDGSTYRYHASAWESLTGEWVNYTPNLYSNMGAGAGRNTITKTVALARYKLLGGICFMQASVVAGQTSGNGAGLALPFSAIDWQPIIGTALITGTGVSTSQSSVAFMQGAANDSIVCITPTTAFIDIPTGATFRCSVQYRVI